MPSLQNQQLPRLGLLTCHDSKQADDSKHGPPDSDSDGGGYYYHDDLGPPPQSLSGYCRSFFSCSPAGPTAGLLVQVTELPRPGEPPSAVCTVREDKERKFTGPGAAPDKISNVP